MNFGQAIETLKAGGLVARAGWNGKGMWIKLIPLHDWTVGADHGPDVDGLLGLPWIGMKTADNCFVPWLASQTDILAEDWDRVPSAEELTTADMEDAALVQPETAPAQDIAAFNNAVGNAMQNAGNNLFDPEAPAAPVFDAQAQAMARLRGEDNG